ncbi:MAG: YmdB family metallophosphoesterase, partial [Eubacteriales bacterium]
LVFMDFHCEATSEKLAMAYMLDGKVSAVWGTHTHVPTADCQILPKGTGYVTDLGMTGPAQSILGVKPAQSIATFRGDLTSRFEPAEGVCKLEAVLFTVDVASGKTVAVERVDICG